MTLFLGSKNPTSKCQFGRTAQKIEKATEIVEFVFLKIIVPCLTLPRLISSFLVYLITDLGNDAFVLPIPIW